MISSHRIAVTDESSVGEVRRHVSNLCRDCGMDDVLTGQAAIVSTEMARNIVRHAAGGDMIVRQYQEQQSPRLELLALDKGPGIRDVNASMRDGASTAGTAGTGLGAIKRLSSRFEIYTQVGGGTVVWSRLGELATAQAASSSVAGFEFGGVCVAVEGEVLCGDGWHAMPSANGERLRVLLADGLGHGPLAEAAASEAIATFIRHPNSGPAECLEYLHHALMKTRGAAVSMVEINPKTQLATGCGVGNVSMRVITGPLAKTLISDNGTLGCNVRKLQQNTQPWSEGTLLIMHSDGLGTQWNIADYPGLAIRHPSVVAGVLYRDFRRQRDDSTVIVVRHHA